tara:strand:+ start:2939 stop:3979 length:1041 start_codon:yes stop_codon:yes gene_type:complete
LSQHPILSCSFDALAQTLAGSGRAKAIWSLLRNGQDPFQAPLGKKLTRALNQNLTAFDERVTTRHQSPCGTLKLGIALQDKLEVETVLIPMNGRTTVCISSQVGCARGCTFCSTGQMNLIRNLKAHEILFQVYAARRCIQESQDLPPFRNIVFMGMGEPLNNFEEVKKAITQMVHPLTFAIGAKRITLSTVGPSPSLIQKLKTLPTRIAWSIHAAEDTKRQRLVPTTKHSIAALTDAFADVLHRKKEGLFIELTLIDNVNDRDEDAHHLVTCLKRLPGESRVNLIPVNPTPGNSFAPPTPERIQSFRAILHEAGYFCSVRPSRGDEEAAACGQLITLRTQEGVLAQ